MTDETTNTERSRVAADCPNERLVSQQRPRCHMTLMDFAWADDGCQQVEYWECRHCGHTKEIQRYLAG